MARKRIADRTITIIIDEIGNPGLDPFDDPYFIISAAVIKNPIEFGEISRVYRKRWNREELKSKTSTPYERAMVISEISKLDHRVNVVYIDKNANDNPKWYTESRNRNIAYRNTLSELMDDTFGSTVGNEFIILLDNHHALRDGHGERIIEDSAKPRSKKVRECHIEDSKTGEHRNLSQTNDFIPREAKEIIRGGKETSALDINIRRITQGNSKRYAKR